MLTAKLYGPNDIRVVDIEKPNINANEILVKTGIAAICGTDLRMIANGYKNIDEEHPLTLGHEFSGTIEAIGDNVKKYTVGQRISVAPNYGCGICDACARGDTHLCHKYKAFGINIPGAFAEYIRIPEEVVSQGNITVLADTISFEEAALFEPASCVLNGQELTGIEINDEVLVIGAGPIGVMHAMLAKSFGAGQVYINDLSKERMDCCVKLVPGTIALPGKDLLTEVMKATNGRGLDVCIVACPSRKAQENSLELMAMNGKIIFFGGLPEDRSRVILPSNIIHYRQLSIQGCTRANVSTYRKIVSMSKNNLVNFEPIVTDVFLLKDFRKAIETAKTKKGLKCAIKF